MGFCDASKSSARGNNQTHSDGAALLVTARWFSGLPLTLAARFLMDSITFTLVSSACYTLSV